jgi:hypothetical protein
MRKTGWILFVSGVAGGVALVIACNHVSVAKAAPSDCAAWQYAKADDLATIGALQPTEIGTTTGSPPAPIYAFEITGWQPFAVQADTTVLLRRCKP